jgi:hypothetical protein
MASIKRMASSTKKSSGVRRRLTLRPAASAPFLAGGVKALAKPSFCASLSRKSVRPTARTSPESATSPKATVSRGKGASASAEISAAATARSAAGSVMRKPPATER